MKKVIYFVSEDWVFLNHRIDLAKKIQKKGYKIVLVTKTTHYKKEIEKNNIKVISIKTERGSLNIRKAIKNIFQLRKIIKNEKTKIIHNFGLKQIILGTLASAFSKTKVANSIIGLGSIFISKKFFLKFLITNILRLILFSKRSVLLVQNKDDYLFFNKKIFVNKNNLFINTTSGIDLKKISAKKEKGGKIIFLFASRLIKDKGLIELIEASKKLHKLNKNFLLYIAGKIDSDNPSSIDIDYIKSLNAFNYIKYLGHVKNMSELYKNIHIAILPSYREGLPKGLLEAAAHSKPIITTDVPGCKEIVKDNINGYIVNPKNIDELTSSMKTILSSKKKRILMGKKSREIIKKNFLLDKTVNDLIKIYNNLL